MNRRSVLRSAVVVAAGLAGCTGGGQPSGGYGDWFEDVSNFDGTVDRTGKESIRVDVGTEANGGAFGFSPPAVAVSAGAVVTWVWTGEGGEHNVVAESGSFSSRFASSQGYTYERRFDRPGTILYYCEPHLSLGMKGAIVVED